jgi:HlyD family secretion protein
MKKLIIPGIVVLVLAVTGYAVFLRSPAAKYTYRFEKVSEGDLTAFVTATGSITPVTSVDVGTQVSGIVAKLYADFNSVVKQGQVIAQIDPTFLEQSVKDAEANLEKAQALAADAKRNYDREKELLAKGLDSQLNHDAALTTYESNKAALKSARASLDRAKINLAYATIYAPISGVVINRAVNVGQTVAASFSSPTLYTIANDLSKMQVLAIVDESDIGKISIGQEATFTVDAYPDQAFKGVVSQVRLNPTTIQNVVNYTVVIFVNNDQLKLMPGMTASVKVQVAEARNVLRIPNMALRFQPPTELQDTAKVNSLKESFGGKGRGGEGGVVASGGQENAGGGQEGGQNRFRALRDSITAAHGGNISQEDLRAEIQQVIALRKGEGEGSAKPVMPQRKALPKTAKFGIDLRFPEYEKSPYVASHQSGRGRVWILNAAGKLEPVMVRTGVTDGKFTEITSQSLKSGDQIVMGASADGNDLSATSPFTSGQQQGPRGGFR